MAKNVSGQGIDQANARGTNRSTTESRSDREARADRERSIPTRREESIERGRALAHRPASYAATPFSALRRVFDDMDELFEDFSVGRPGLRPSLRRAFGTDSWGDEAALAGATWTPHVETFRRGDQIVVRADLPGLRKEDVKVDVDNDTLAISGERKDEHEEERDGYYWSERSYGQFYRVIPLPEGVNAEQCDATFKDGVLEVTMAAPRQAEQRSKRVQIR